MDTDRQTRIEQILHSALKCDAAERAAFLREACAGDLALLEAVGAQMPALNSLTPTQTFAPDWSALEEKEHQRSLIGCSLGPYQVLSPLGRGGMGEVYLALDSLLQRKVAVKLLPLEFTGDRNRVRRFEHEAKAASALNHPNIVSIYGAGESEFGQYIAMEWIEGRNLRAFKPLPLAAATVRDIGVQVATALAVTHAAGLVHRDIKPDNIMVRHDGLAKVLDFGLARLVGAMSELMETGVTVPGSIVGTVSYMSPEQARGEWLTAASDIFSLGIVFYELATGQHPFQADSAVGYLHSIVSRQVIAPSRLTPEIPAWLETLLLGMLEKDPARRCTALETVSAFEKQDSAAPGDVRRTAAAARHAIGREKERAELQSSFQSVAKGRSSMLCISGEPGQGKTTLVEEFLADVVNRNSALVGRGRCSERLAGAEAYLPILEALDGLLSGVEREAVVAAMKSLAPTWYAQLVPASTPALPAGMPSPEKLKRELATLLKEISRQQPVVIFLDDVQWADLSTIDLLSYLSSRLEGIRALILVTFRAPELNSGNPQFLALQLDLTARGICREIALGFFSVDEIRAFIELKFPGHGFPAEFASEIHRYTEGNPLFVADLLRYLQERQAILARDGRWILNGPIDAMLTGLPESVRSMVQRKMEQLAENQRKVLMAASIQGSDFDAAVVARALDADPADIEEGLEQLERKSGFVKLIAEYEYPDRSLTLRYRFVHALYQNAFFAALRPTRRTSLSKAVAEALLQFHGAQAGKIAAQLGFLFETARDFVHASSQYQIASQNALHLFASSEAEKLARRGLDAVHGMPEGMERARQELDLQKVLAGALRNLRSHAGGDAIATQRRLLELAEELKDYYTVFAVHYAIAWSSTTHQQFARTLEEGAHCLRIAEQIGDRCMIDAATLVCGDAMTHQGRLVESRGLFERVGSPWDPATMALYARLLGPDPAPHARGVLGLVLSYLGYLDQARARLRESAGLAVQGNPMTQGIVLICAILSFKHFRDQQALSKSCEELTAICLKNELHVNMMYFAKFGQGWILALQGNAAKGLAKVDEAMADVRAIGLTYGIPMMAFGKAEVMRLAGRRDEALQFLDEQLAAAESCGQWLEVPDLYRAKGELLSGAPAEECFRRAIESARRMEARLPELEASSSLAELYRAEGRKAEAKDVLSGVYGWFTEGFGTPGLKRAKTILQDLSR
jgi:serine/threonine protein kinase/tetratricopeptide (TPR) repeat protein